MAVLACSSRKENVPPRHGLPIKSHGMKRPGVGGIKAWRRAPLYDITNLFLATRLPSAAGTSAAVTVQSREEPAPEAAQSGAPDLITVKERRSLRTEFR